VGAIVAEAVGLDAGGCVTAATVGTGAAAVGAAGTGAGAAVGTATGSDEEPQAATTRAAINTVRVRRTFLSI